MLPCIFRFVWEKCGKSHTELNQNKKGKRLTNVLAFYPGFQRLEPAHLKQKSEKHLEFFLQRILNIIRIERKIEHLNQTNNIPMFKRTFVIRYGTNPEYNPRREIDFCMLEWKCPIFIWKNLGIPIETFVGIWVLIIRYCVRMGMDSTLSIGGHLWIMVMRAPKMSILFHVSEVGFI